MQDPADNVTADLLKPVEAPKRKRGRPATGQAKTAAERKAAQRWRDRRALGHRLDQVSTRGLADELASAAAMGQVSTAKWLADELLRRAAAVRDARQDEPASVTVTKNDPVVSPAKSVTVTQKPKTHKPVTVTKKAPAAKSVTVTKKTMPKYRNPNTGETWSGRGLQPKWVQCWIAQGRFLAELEL